VDLVGKGASVFFFPEGTRSRDGKLGVFKVRFYQTISYFSVHYAFNFFLEQ
jgi:1-acyl-sn-glycerol-3-phosphate acyltransferase